MATASADQGRKNYIFLMAIDSATRDIILGNISGHFGISKEGALQKVSEVNASHLVDYMTGQDRSSTEALMQRYCFA